MNEPTERLPFVHEAGRIPGFTSDRILYDKDSFAPTWHYLQSSYSFPVLKASAKTARVCGEVGLELRKIRTVRQLCSGSRAVYQLTFSSSHSFSCLSPSGCEGECSRFRFGCVRSPAGTASLHFEAFRSPVLVGSSLKHSLRLCNQG